MKALAISGGRNPQGQTARATGAVLDGYLQGGGQVEQVFLPAMTIEHCRQCGNDGWGTCRTQNMCCITSDDFADLVEKMSGINTLILATPVYYADLSESMKAFTDRLRRISAGRKRFPNIACVGLCVAGGGGGGAIACCEKLERTAHHCDMNVVDMIAVRRQNLDAKIESLKLVGQWLAGTRAV